jgi:adenine deaminase
MRFCNISLAEALICATRNPARLAGLDTLVGTLTPGCFADLLLLDEQNGQVYLRAVYVGGIRADEVIA